MKFYKQSGRKEMKKKKIEKYSKKTMELFFDCTNLCVRVCVFVWVIAAYYCVWMCKCV